MEYAKTRLGVIGYNVYEKSSDGTTTLLTYTTDTNYSFTPDSDGEHTYIVKTAYSIFKDNESDGVSTKVTVKLNKPKPDPKPDPEPETDPEPKPDPEPETDPEPKPEDNTENTDSDQTNP